MKRAERRWTDSILFIKVNKKGDHIDVAYIQVQDISELNNICASHQLSNA